MDEIFFKLFLFVYYYNIIFEKLIFEKIANSSPSKLINRERKKRNPII